MQGVQAIIQRQECVAAEGDNNRFFFSAKDCGTRFLRPCPVILDIIPIAPLANSLLVDAIALGKPPSTSGRRLILWRCRQRCSDERVKWGMVACKAYRQSSRGRSV